VSLVTERIHTNPKRQRGRSRNRLAREPERASSQWKPLGPVIEGASDPRHRSESERPRSRFGLVCCALLEFGDRVETVSRAVFQPRLRATTQSRSRSGSFDINQSCQCMPPIWYRVLGRRAVSAWATACATTSGGWAAAFNRAPSRIRSKYAP
jgi:hypothetical protein